MPLSLLSLAIGFTVGVVATAFVWNLTTRTVRNPERTRLTSAWGLADVAEGREKVALLTERLEGVEVPPEARVLVPRGAATAVPARVLAEAEVRMHPDVHANFCVGRNRALVFPGHISPRARAIGTMEVAVVKHLQEEFTRLWTEAEPYYEEVALTDAARHEGRIVDVRGFASEFVAFRGRKLMKITRNGASLGVVTDDGGAATLQGGPVRVVGRVKREGSSVYVEAQRVMPLERGALAPVAAGAR